MKKSIIIPMDFTSVAMNAFKYAYKLFVDEDLNVVHVVLPGGKNPQAAGALPGEEKTDFLRHELEYWIKHELDLDRLPENINIQVIKGEVSDVIRDLVKENNYDSLLMGTRDKYSFLDKLLGTVSLSLIKTLEIPIYLIPRYAKYKAFKNVVVASDDHMQRNAVLDNIANWNKDHNAYMNFIHVSKNSKDNFEEISASIVDHYGDRQNEVPFAFEIDSIRADNVAKSLLAKSYNLAADLLMIVPDNQTLLNSLVLNSTSKELILSANIPMLFMNQFVSDENSDIPKIFKQQMI